jgi:hypothetical protein
LNTYKASGSTFILIIKHVSLKELESGLIRGQIVAFLREKRPFKKSTPKSNAASGIIAGELLTKYSPAPPEYLWFVGVPLPTPLSQYIPSLQYDVFFLPNGFHKLLGEQQIYVGR